MILLFDCCFRRAFLAKTEGNVSKDGRKVEMLTSEFKILTEQFGFLTEEFHFLGEESTEPAFRLLWGPLGIRR
jgi:hypothetical protein